MVTLEDAVDALALLELQAPEGSAPAAKLREFLDGLKAKVAPVSIPTDAEGFIIEGALQHGFDHIDDDATLLVVGAQALIDYTKLQRSQPSLPLPFDGFPIAKLERYGHVAPLDSEGGHTD